MTDVLKRIIDFRVITVDEWDNLISGAYVQIGTGSGVYRLLISEINKKIRLIKMKMNNDGSDINSLIKLKHDYEKYDKNDSIFITLSRSTNDEIRNRAQFVCKYIQSYPQWIKNIKFEQFNCWIGMSLVDFDKVYKEFMCYIFGESDDYKTIFEKIIKQNNGIISSEAKYLPFYVNSDVFKYGSIYVKLKDNENINFNIDKYLHNEILSICFKSINHYRISQRMYIAKNDISDIIKSIMFYVNNYITDDTEISGEYDEVIVDIPNCHIRNETFRQIILRCTYGILSIKKFNDNYDCSFYDETIINIIRSIIVIDELKQWLDNYIKSM